MKTKNHILPDRPGLPRNLCWLWNIHKVDVWQFVQDAAREYPMQQRLRVADVYLFMIEINHRTLSRDSRWGWAVPVSVLLIWRAIPLSSHMIPYPRAPSHVRWRLLNFLQPCDELYSVCTAFWRSDGEYHHVRVWSNVYKKEKSWPLWVSLIHAVNYRLKLFSGNGSSFFNNYG